MSEEKYDLVFRGQLAKSVERQTAVRNIAQLFKVDIARAEALFSGKTTVLKRGLDLDTANKYRVTIKKAGALVEVVLDQNTRQKPASEAAAGSSIQQPVEEVKTGTQFETQTLSTSELTTTVGVYPDGAPARQIAPEDVPQVPDLGLEPVGADVLKESERALEQAVAVDISGISLKEPEGKLLNDDEYEKFVPAAIDTDALDLAPVGADVLKPEERTRNEAPEIDLSSLSLGEEGENLAPPKPAPPPPPDTSKISLAED